MVEIGILSFSVVISILTGVFVFLRNPRHIINRLYGLLTLALMVFSVANYLSLATTERLWYIRLVICFAIVFVSSLFYLILLLDGRKNRLTTWQKLGVYVSVVIAILNMTPLVFSGLRGAENPVPVPSLAAPLFVITLIFFLSASIAVLFKRIHRSKGTQKLQYVYILFGTIPILVLSPLTGIVMPIAFQNASLVFLSPVYTAFLICMMGYAIVKHKLFDVRVVVARSLAYTASLLIIALTYGFAVFGVSQLVFDLKLSLTLQVVLSLLTGLAALAFQRLRGFFDKVTNRLFYQDAYDPRLLFDEYNKALVSTIDLQILMKRTAAVIAKHMRAEYCALRVRGRMLDDYYLDSADGLSIPQEDVRKILAILSKLRQRIIVTDDLSIEHGSLQNMLRKYDVAVLIALSTGSDGRGDSIGLMAIGSKKSGNTYTGQDVQVLQALANELIIALQNALRFEEIERFNETLQQRVEDATYKLRQTNKKLKQLDQTKDDFIGMTSHQLRTPLTSIKGYISLVMDGDAGEITETQRKLLNQAFTSAQKVVFLVADLLNVSRLKTGKFVIERVSSDLSKVVGDEVDQLKEEASARDLTMSYVPPKNFPILPLDEIKTRQVIMNFLDNAIYYTPHGGKIVVELEELPESVEFRVVDNGIGVPKADHHQLFTKFYRARNAQRARPDGTGLGLYMASKVVVAQGGAIIFNSKEGKGSVFGFSFPKNMPEGQVPFPAQSHE